MKIDAEQQPDVRAIYGTKLFKVMADYEYVVDADCTITVPKGFVCDCASIPQILWSWLGVRLGGRIRAAAVVHDWIYYNEGAAEACGGREFPKDAGDWLFKRIMQEAGMERGRVRKCFLGVYLFARKAWNTHKRRIALDKQLDEIEREADDGGDA